MNTDTPQTDVLKTLKNTYWTYSYVSEAVKNARTLSDVKERLNKDLADLERERDEIEDMIREVKFVLDTYLQ